MNSSLINNFSAVNDLDYFALLLIALANVLVEILHGDVEGLVLAFEALGETDLLPVRQHSLREVVQALRRAHVVDLNQVRF